MVYPNWGTILWKFQLRLIFYLQLVTCKQVTKEALTISYSAKALAKNFLTSVINPIPKIKLSCAIVAYFER